MSVLCRIGTGVGFTFLLLGAVVNVAVAWSCSIFVDVHSVDRQCVGDVFGWGFDVWRTAGATRIHCNEFVMCAVGAGYDAPPPVPDSVPWWGPTDFGQFRRNGRYIGPPMEDARGWPLLSMWCEYEYVWPPGAWRTNIEHGAMSVPMTRAGRGRRPITMGLPLRPIWHGFLANSAFYAVLLYSLTGAPFTVRQSRRRRRGRCLSCGYDLRGRPSQGCPECGWRREANGVESP